MERGSRAGLRSLVKRGSAPLGWALAALVTGCSGAGDSGGPVSADAKANLQTMSHAYAGMSLDAIQNDPNALDVGGQLFAAYCAGCHGADGRGERGTTDLTRGRFSFGASAEAVRLTIRDGRRSEMPGQGGELGEVDLGQLVAYLGTLSSDEPLSDFEERGRVLFAERCVACHDPDGSGNTELGVPDLTDDYWQHGGSMMNIRLVITRGVQSECPAHGEELSPAEIELLTAHVLRLESS
jgi:cytochrome c oxidase cbb3-type subunit 3